MPVTETIVACVLALGVIVGALRLALRRSGRRPWRYAVQVALAALSAVLLHLTLFPPRLPIGGETLVVATARPPAGLRPLRGERLVALPEAGRVAGAERVPDLATALRRHGRVARLRVAGEGLTARDRPAAIGLPLDFRPPPLPAGLLRLEPPAETTAGAVFTVAGAVSGYPGARAELVDPAGRRVDAMEVPADGRFALTGTARTAGEALFAVRLRNASGGAIEDAPVVVHAEAKRPVRLLLVGAPGPETKYLRRWAADAGLAVRSRLGAGGGVTLGDDVASLDPPSLRNTDVAIVDDVSWQAAGGARSPLGRAVAGELGVVVRITRPPGDALLREGRALGLAFGGGDLSPVRLPPVAIDPDALAARRGPGEAEAGLSAIDDPAPDLARWDLRPGSGAVIAVRDAGDAALGAWSARGAGRLAFWAVPDSYALWLAGRRELYEQWWSGIVAAVARPTRDFAPKLPDIAWAGERTVICGVAAEARVTGPDGAQTPLLPQSGEAGGCAGYWPERAGVHLVRPTASRDGSARAFYVHRLGALPAARSQEVRDATSAMATATTAPRSPTNPGPRGPAWPWLLAWLLVAGALWWLERAGAEPDWRRRRAARRYERGIHVVHRSELAGRSRPSDRS